MTSYTTIGQELWLWQPFVSLSDNARMTWLGLYSSPHAKRFPIGLWRGSVQVLAEEIHKAATDVYDALAELGERGLIERDDRSRVVAMTILPDRHERPHNGNCLKKWWNLFRGIPACDVRDRWVRLLAWLCSPMTRSHEEVWSGTFGTVYPQPVDNSLQSALHYLQDSSACGQPVDKQVCLVFSGTPETVTDTVPRTHRNQGSGIRDLGSELRDQGEGSGEREPPKLTLLEGGKVEVEPTQEHDQFGRPWGPEGPPRNQFFTGRRRNL